MLIILLTILPCWSYIARAQQQQFSIKEATISDIQLAFQQRQLTSRQLVEYYLKAIERLNPVLNGVVEVNPDALSQADKADKERVIGVLPSLIGLHGIPVLLKGNIGTKDKLNTTGGSFALLGSKVPRDAGVVTKLRDSGVIILGKASLNEWSSFRSTIAPNGWSARGGYGKNPYVLSADPCGSSSGSAISTAANFVTISLGTENDGSILCPASFNSVVGIKPTVGITSMDQVIPISPRQDTVGTVADAVYVLDAVVGPDENDPETIALSKYIPPEGYKKHLKVDGLKGKKLGIVRNPFFGLLNDSIVNQTFEKHFQTLRQEGAIVIDNLEIPNIDVILDPSISGETIALLAEYKLAINAYLKDLEFSPVRSLEDVISFNKRNANLEMIMEYGQDIFLASQATDRIGEKEKEALANLTRLSRDGFEN
ncbi:Amidase signature domain [Sesbania bispinosa]|nr:Amidase signature domain [Sesbania bispinosa]